MKLQTNEYWHKNFEERQELVQDVVDRLMSNPEYKEKLRELNKKFPPLKDFNRRLESYRRENEAA
jgi:hypothetical protein